MNNYKTYIFAALLLLGGLAIGWFLKPSSNNTMEGDVHNHSATDKGGEEIWTCSMHPQIRQNEPGICPICEMDLIPLDNTMANDDPTILRMSKEAAKLAQVETYVIGGNTKTMAESDNRDIKADGTVELDERTIKSQTAHLSGRIESMAVTFEGQYVSKGQQIATIYSTELLAASQELLTAAQYNDRVEGLKDAAIQKLNNWKVTDAQIQQILTTGQPIATIQIYADHSGYVLAKKLSQGDYVKQGQALYTLGSTSRLWLLFNVYESDVANIMKGSQVTFTSSSVPNKEFKAKITYIDPLMNSASRTATVRAEINNTGNLLKPGMLLTGMIYGKKPSTTPKKGTITIPNSAILWTGDRSVVYVSMPDNDVPTYQYREVEIGNRSSKTSTIINGLEPGEEIVMNGAFAIDAAAQLNNNLSMMNRNVKVKEEEQSEVGSSFADQTPDEFVAQLDKGVMSYLELKNALVETDKDAASLSADMFLKSINEIDMNLIKGEAHIYWMEQLNSLKSHGESIKISNEIEKQRDQFDFLSQTMINTLKAFGTVDKTYYVQYCPMAKDNQGADWISTESQIRNPYFGDKMMKCGSVKLELN